MMMVLIMMGEGEDDSLTHQWQVMMKDDEWLWFLVFLLLFAGVLLLLQLHLHSGIWCMRLTEILLHERSPPPPDKVALFSFPSLVVSPFYSAPFFDSSPFFHLSSPGFPLRLRMAISNHSPESSEIPGTGVCVSGIMIISGRFFPPF